MACETFLFGCMIGEVVVRLVTGYRGLWLLFDGAMIFLTSVCMHSVYFG